VGEPNYTFLKRGKMINYKRMEPQNTTISALVVLENLAVGQRRAQVEIGRRKRELGRALDGEELWSFLHELPGSGVDNGQLALRVVVYENPYARIHLTREIFSGPFDERYGPEGNYIVRIYAGAEIQRLEAMEGKTT
jgi:hypothetical protein